MEESSAHKNNLEESNQDLYRKVIKMNKIASNFAKTKTRQNKTNKCRKVSARKWRL